MSSPSGALPRAAVLLTVLALLLGALVTVLPFRAGAEPAAAPTTPSAPERRYAPGIDPALDADATITGLVLGPRGRLRDNVLVEAFSALDPTGEPVASDLTYEVGDIASHGAYALHLPAGDYVLRYASPDGATSILEPTVYAGGATVTLDPHEERRLETVVMQDDGGAPVTGRVLGVGGQPYIGAWVYLVRPSGVGYVVRRQEETDVDGTFAFDGVRRGRDFTVAVVTDDDLPVLWLGGAPSHLTATTFRLSPGSTSHELGDLRLSAGVPVSGHVTSPTGPPESADVALVHLGGPGASSIVAWDWTVAADGSYTLPALPGTYTIGVLPYGDYDAGDTLVYLGDTTDLDQATTFTVGADSLTVPDLVLSRRTIEVTVDVVDPAGVLDAEEADVLLLGTDGDYLGSAYPTGTGDRWSARVRFGTRFTIAVLDWSSDGEWFLGGADTFDQATFVTAPASGSTLHAGAISLTGTGLTAPTPALLGQALRGQVLMIETPQWSVAGATSSYQWLRDGLPVPSATFPAYLLGAADVGHQVSVRVTGRAAGRVGTVTSGSRLVSGGSPAVIVPPTIVGPVRGTDGRFLAATTGTWDDPGIQLALQWNVDGQPVAGATGPRLPLVPSYAGRSVTVTVTAVLAGQVVATSVSAGYLVPRLTPTFKAVRRKQTIQVQLSAPGTIPETGRVVLRDSKKIVARTVLGAGGRATFDLVRLRMKPGRHRLYAEYAGNRFLVPRRAQAVRVVVR